MNMLDMVSFRLGTLKRCTGTSTGRLMIAVLAASPT
jgi:hypothetical protein